jgi:hypothetical protein
METRKPIKAITAENKIPTGPANRFMQKGGGNPARDTTMGLLITSGIKISEITRLNSMAMGGINLSTLLEINPNKGIEKANARGTAIRRIGFTISAL